MTNYEQDLAEISVTQLDIGNRALNCLKKAGIRTVADLVQMEPSDLTDIRGFGPGCLQETVEALLDMGLKLRPVDFVARR